MADGGNDLAIDALAEYFDNFDSDCEEGTQNVPVNKPDPAPTSNSKYTEDDGFLSQLNIEERTKPEKTEEIPKNASITPPTAISSASTNNECADEDDGSFIYDHKERLDESGEALKNLIEKRSSVTSTSFYNSNNHKPKTHAWTALQKKTGSNITPEEQTTFEPLCGVAIVKPRIPMSFLKDCSKTAKVIPLASLPRQKHAMTNDTDWVTVGVISSKSDPRQSKNDRCYIILQIIDMVSPELYQVSLFLFGDSYTQHWKLPVGTVIGLLNASILPNEQKNNSKISLSINQAAHLLVIGSSKDLSVCGTQTKAGSKCVNPVNKRRCDKCQYHVMAAHKKISRGRAELNNSFAGREPAGVRQRIMNKLAAQNKDEMFIMNGKSISTKLTKPAVKATLAGVLTNNKASKTNVNNVLFEHRIDTTDLEKIASAKQTVEENEQASELMKKKRLEVMISQPSAGGRQMIKHLINAEKHKGVIAGEITLVPQAANNPSALIKEERLKRRLGIPTGSPSAKPAAMSREAYNKLKMDKAKQILKSSGGIHNENTSSVKSAKTVLSDHQKLEIKKTLEKELTKNKSLPSEKDVTDNKSPTSEKRLSQKRKLSVSPRDESGSPVLAEQKLNKQIKFTDVKLTQEDIVKIRNCKSSNTNLRDQVESDKQDAYFSQLERKEQYQEKLETTHTIEAPLFSCSKCNYEDWKLSNICIKEKHRWKKVQVNKRFFKCRDCKDRTFTHHKYPTQSCRKCSGSNFEKAGMVAEKLATPDNHVSVRGNEETYLGHVQGKINLDI